MKQGKKPAWLCTCFALTLASILFFVSDGAAQTKATKTLKNGVLASLPLVFGYDTAQWGCQVSQSCGM